MKRLKGKFIIVAISLMVISLSILPCQHTIAQESILQQNISLKIKEKPLIDIIHQVNDILGLQLTFNANVDANMLVSFRCENEAAGKVLKELLNRYQLDFMVSNGHLIVHDFFDNDLNNYRLTEPSAGKQVHPPFVFNNPQNKSVAIPFIDASNLIIIPVRINNSRNLNFILDTGVKVPTITEFPDTSKLNLKFLQPLKLTGLGELKQVNAYSSFNNKIEFPGITGYNQTIHILDNPDFRISPLIGVPVHGLIGFNLLKDYVVKIDYTRKIIYLYQPEQFNMKRALRKSEVIDLDITGGKPLIDARVVINNGLEVPVKLMVDLGASDAAWLSSSSDSRLKPPDNSIGTFLGRGLAGDLYGKKARIQAIEVGRVTFEEPIVSFPDTSHIGGITGKERNGSIGGEILRRFIVVVDYPNHRMLLQPGRKIHEPFYYNMSGIDVVNPMPGLPYYKIINVQKGSPGDLAGLMPEDEIIYINHTAANNITLSEINQLLMSRENRNIKMLVKRNGQLKRAEFRLRKVF